MKWGLCLSFALILIMASSQVSALTFGYNNPNLPHIKQISNEVPHGMIDWVYTIIGMDGDTSCNNLDNQITGYSYTCQTCIDTAGSSIACSTTLITLNANCGCKVD